QAIQQPRTHAGPTGDGSSGAQKRMRRVMIDLLRMHRSDDANLIGNLGNMGKNRADFLSGFSNLRKRKLWRETDELLALELRDLLAVGVRVRHWFAVQFRQLWLMVKRLQMRRPARHAQKYDPLGFRGEMRRIENSAPLVWLLLVRSLGRRERRQRIYK